MEIIRQEKLPYGFKVISWSSDLEKAGVTVQQLLDMRTKQINVALRYKKKGIPTTIIVLEKSDEKDDNEVFRKIREVEIEFGVPASISPYCQQTL